MVMPECSYVNATTSGPFDAPSRDWVSAGIHVNRGIALAEYEEQVPKCVQRRTTEGYAFGADEPGEITSDCPRKWRSCQHSRDAGREPSPRPQGSACVPQAQIEGRSEVEHLRGRH